MRRVAHILERSGFRISFCGGILSETFSIVADSIYLPSKDSGIYIKVAIDSITKEMLDLILNYRTHRKKELWILRFGKSSSDPGMFLIYRIDGGKIIEHPKGWPVEKVKSSPQKKGVNPL